EGRLKPGGRLLDFTSDGKEVVTISEGLIHGMRVETGKVNRMIMPYGINRTADGACSPVAPVVAVAQARADEDTMTVTDDPDRVDLRQPVEASIRSMRLRLPGLSTSPLAYTRDGGTLVLVGGGSVYLVDAKTGAERVKLERPKTMPGRDFSGYQAFASAPDAA